jgi:hypothetical protein
MTYHFSSEQYRKNKLNLQNTIAKTQKISLKAQGLYIHRIFREFLFRVRASLNFQGNFLSFRNSEKILQKTFLSLKHKGVAETCKMLSSAVTVHI